MIKGERGMRVQEATAIAEFLQLPPEEVLRHAGAETAPTVEHPRRGRSASALRPVPIMPVAWSDLIPIRSSSDEGGRDAAAFTPRPPNLMGVRDAYATYSTDDALSPRYEPGWLLYVNPLKPAQLDRDVVVIKTDRAMLVRQFLGWNGESLVLGQLKPQGTMTVPRQEVAACHLVVGVDQEG